MISYLLLIIKVKIVCWVPSPVHSFLISCYFAFDCDPLRCWSQYKFFQIIYLNDWRGGTFLLLKRQQAIKGYKTIKNVFSSSYLIKKYDENCRYFSVT